MTYSKPPRERGFNVVGYITGNLGLGVAARNTISRLVAAGESVSVVDINPGHRHSGNDTTHACLPRPTFESAYSTNLFHLNPPEALGHRLAWQPLLSVKTSLNVCVPFWELPLLPPSWVEALRCMDYVLAPTRFIEAACLRALPSHSVIYYPQSVHLPEAIVADRRRWSIPADVVSFLVTFDINSDVARKNPWASIEAFSLAFPADVSVCLVVRVNGQPETPITMQQMVALEAAAAADPRIRLVRGPLAYRDVLSLYASCDVLVSLHRAEGLGLHLMEAMSLGKPIVTTGWSGNVDFMDEDSACLVPAHFVPVEATQESYSPRIIGPGQYWAEPNVAVAAEYLRQLADDSEYRLRIGSRARQRILEHFDTVQNDTTLTHLAETSVASVRRTRESRARVRRFTRLLGHPPSARRGFVESIRHSVVVLLRLFHLYPQPPEEERQRREAERRLRGVR